MANNTGKNILNGLFIAAISAGAALLLAPKSGEETRKAIKREAKRYADKGQKFAEDLQEDIRQSIAEIDSDPKYDKKSLADTIQEQNEAMEADLAELEANQEIAYTQEGEVTAVDKPSGNVTGTQYDGDGDTMGVDQETVVAEDGSVSQVERPSGNVTDSRYDTASDQVVPADELDEALEDNDMK